MPVAFLPVHEVLEVVTEEAPESWASLGAQQDGVRRDLQGWAARMAVDIQVGLWVALSVWGDSAPYSKKGFAVFPTVGSGTQRGAPRTYMVYGIH